VVDRQAAQSIVHAVASQGGAEGYGHSFNRNKAVIWRMSVDLSEYLVGQVLQSKRRQFGVLQKFYATADRDDWRLGSACSGSASPTVSPAADGCRS
jgi:hypothetical protein